jgi:hypothetical protein
MRNFSCLIATLSMAISSLAADTPPAAPDFTSPFFAVGFSRTAPAFTYFSVDSLGKSMVTKNPVLAESAAATPTLTFQPVDNRQFTYRARSTTSTVPWRVSCTERKLILHSEHTSGTPSVPFALKFDQNLNHATLLGLMRPGEKQVRLPCVMHLPDLGSVRISSNVPGATLDYDASRSAKLSHPFVSVEFPPATAEMPEIEYTLEAVAIYPAWAGVEENSAYDGFRRNFLNLFQVNARLQMLANNSASDPCSFTLFLYAEGAAVLPPLAPGLNANDLIRMTLDRYLSGAKGYGQAGYAADAAPDSGQLPWKTPYTSLDTLPSLLISACTYIESSGDSAWANAHFDQIAAWARVMMASDKNGNGLIEYPATGNLGDRPTFPEKLPANWWDAINFGHEDALANALAYRACVKFASLATHLHRPAEAKVFTEHARRLRAAYVPTFLNPATGVLAGWKSVDGDLHDYWFTFIQGVAISSGLVDDGQADIILDRIVAKMKVVGYEEFHLGLPGNLIPIRKGDYYWDTSGKTPPTLYGEPRLEDGSDGFQYYENGGATGCWTYFLIHALYQQGRVDEARAIFLPILEGYRLGNFQGRGADGRSNDWRDWQGNGHGYEGMLVDNYFALLAVRDELAARKRHP